MKKILPAMVAASALLSLAACKTAGPDYRAPPVLTGEAPAPELSDNGPAFTSQPLPDHWWQLYRDPALDALVEKALVHNTDLRSAAANLARALALLGAADARRLPETSLSVNPTYGQQSADATGAPQALDPGPVYKAGEMISYDFDLFGRLQRGVEAQDANAGAALAALDLARVNVAAQTTLAYVDSCSANLRIAVQKEAITRARQNLDVTQRRFAAGITGRNDVVRARTLLRQTEASLPPLLTDRRSALLRLATLTGDLPENEPSAAAACTEPPILADPIPTGDGRALLRRRPDVREAERRLAQSIAQIGVQAADLYPSISLGASIGTTATKIEDIVRDRGFRWSIGPLLTWTFPNRSIARAQLAAADAQAEARLANFDGTVLTALRETETSMAQLAQDLDRAEDLRLAEEDAALAARNVRRLYKGGVAGFLDVLDAERTLIQSKTELASARAQVATDQVRVFEALGGGWRDAPAIIRKPVTPVIRQP